VEFVSNKMEKIVVEQIDNLLIIIILITSIIKLFFYCLSKQKVQHDDMLGMSEAQEMINIINVREKIIEEEFIPPERNISLKFKMKEIEIENICDYCQKNDELKNCSVYIESKSHKQSTNIHCGSGILAKSIDGKQYILTGAHVVTHNEIGIPKLHEDTRISIPNSNGTEFERIHIDQNDIVVHPKFFYQVGNVRKGADLALIKISPKQSDKINNCGSVFIRIAPFAYDLKGLELSELQVLGFSSLNIDRALKFYSSTITRESLKIQEIDLQDCVKVKMYGNNGALFYINNTLGGMSGGPVIATYSSNNCKEDKVSLIVGIHVAGFELNSQATAFTKKNCAWIDSQSLV